MYHPSYLSPKAKEETIRKTQTSGPRITGNDITRGELESLEMIVKARLSLAVFHRAPVVRVQELQKQLWLLKIEKSGVTS